MAEHFTHVPFATDYMRSVLKVVKAHLTERTGELTGLDIPAGNGWLADQMRDMGVRVTAADINKERLDYVQADMELPLPFEDKAFDIVTSLEGIEHVFNPAKLFSELARLLRPGGLLVITTPNLQNLATRWQHLCCGYPFQFDPFDKIPLKKGETYDKGHISPVFYTQLRYYAEHNGLRVEPPRGGHIRERALKLIVFFPFLIVGSLWVWRDWKKTSGRKDRLDIIRHLFSWSMLHSRSLIFVCRKPTQ